MSSPTDTRLMDTSPGGSSPNQYEGAIVTSPNLEQKPHFGNHKPLRGDALRQAQKEEKEREWAEGEDRRLEEAMGREFSGVTMAGRKVREGGGDGEGEMEREEERKRMGYEDGEGSEVGA